MTKEIRSGGWTGKKSGEPDETSAETKLGWCYIAGGFVFALAINVVKDAGYRLEVDVFFLSLVVLWLSVGLLRHMRVLWRITPCAISSRTSVRNGPRR